MSKEELTQLPEAELAEKVIALEKELKSVTETKDYWYQKADKVTTKYNALKDTIKGLILIIE